MLRSGVIKENLVWNFSFFLPCDFAKNNLFKHYFDMCHALHDFSCSMGKSLFVTCQNLWFWHVYSISRLSLYRSQFYLKNSQKIPLNYVSDLVGREHFSEVKIEGQGQGHKKIKNYIFVDNLRTDGLGIDFRGSD